MTAAATWKVWTALGLVYVLWGSTYLAIKYVVETLPPMLSAAGRFGVAGLLLAASAVMGAVRQALNAAWDVAQPRPPLQDKLVDVLLVFATGVVISTSVAMTLAVQLVASLGKWLGGPGALAPDAILLAGRLVPALLRGSMPH